MAYAMAPRIKESMRNARALIQKPAYLVFLGMGCGLGVGGEGGIRTLETLASLPAFQASALSHYATSP